MELEKIRLKFIEGNGGLRDCKKCSLNKGELEELCQLASCSANRRIDKKDGYYKLEKTK